MKLSGAAVRRFLEKPDKGIAGALLYGPNRSLVADAARQLATYALKGTDDPFALTRLSDDELKKDKARLADALAAQSLLGGPRVAWVKIEGAGADEPLLAALADIEAGLAGAFLIVEGGDLGGGAKLVKAFEAAKAGAAAAFYEETAAERAAYARDLLKAEAVALTREAGEAIFDLLPEDRALMRGEIEKLALFAHGREAPIGLGELSALLPDESDEALDAAIAAALAGRAGAAAEALARVEGVNGVAAIKAMERKLLRLLEARTLMDQGLSATDAAGKLRPPVFWKERDAFQAQLRSWSAVRLSRALDALWKAEIAAKQAQSPQALLAADAFQKTARFAG
ncbi:MAG: DNA polymerase III subunit delta [Hyphomonadaceae bacterium]